MCYQATYFNCQHVHETRVPCRVRSRIQGALSRFCDRLLPRRAADYKCHTLLPEIWRRANDCPECILRAIAGRRERLHDLYFAQRHRLSSVPTSAVSAGFSVANTAHTADTGYTGTTLGSASLVPYYTQTLESPAPVHLRGAAKTLRRVPKASGDLRGTFQKHALPRYVWEAMDAPVETDTEAAEKNTEDYMKRPYKTSTPIAGVGPSSAPLPSYHGWTFGNDNPHDSMESFFCPAAKKQEDYVRQQTRVLA